MDDDEDSFASVALPQPAIQQDNPWTLPSQQPQQYPKPLALWRVKNVLDTSPLNSRDLFEPQTIVQIPQLPRFQVPVMAMQPGLPLQSGVTLQPSLTVQTTVQPAGQGAATSPPAAVQPLEFLACQALSELGMKRVALVHTAGAARSS